MIDEQKIKEILKIKGKVRGVVFQTDAKYILYKKGKEGLEMLKSEIKGIEQQIIYDKEIKATNWYPLSWRVLSLLAIQKTFNWGKKEIFEMGIAAPKYSFIVKTLLRYFISLKKTFTESAKYWKEHYSVGELEAAEINTSKKYLVIRVKDFKIHPILCVYFKGYFKTLSQLVVNSEKVTIKETKCMFKGDLYHEFIINWE